MMGGSITPLPLLNGQVDAAGRDSSRPAASWEPIEALAFAHQASMVDRARKLLDAGRDHDAAQIIDQWVMAVTAAHLAVVGPDQE